MDSLFRGCTDVSSDVIQKLIAKGHNCLIRTNKCFWKDVANVTTRIKTRSVTKKKTKLSLKSVSFT